MKMYRVHDARSFHTGLYASDTAANLFECSGRHPPPDNDSLLRNSISCDKIRGRYSFGFATLEQFTRWVYQADWWQQLDEEGYAISELESPDVHVGYTQAVFRSNDYKILRTVRVTQWERLQDATYDKPFEPYVAVQTQSDCDILGSLLASAIQLNTGRASDLYRFAVTCPPDPVWYFKPA